MIYNFKNDTLFFNRCCVGVFSQKTLNLSSFFTKKDKKWQSEHL